MITRCCPGCSFCAHDPIHPLQTLNPSESGQVDTGLARLHFNLQSFPLIGFLSMQANLDSPLLRPKRGAAEAYRPSQDPQGPP